MHLDPAMLSIVGTVLVILLVGIVTRIIQQPHVIAYLLAGIVLGPFVLGVIDDQDLLNRIGGIGVIVLLFFIGMEISPKTLLANWKVSVVGTLLQIIISVTVMYAVGKYLGWPLHRAIFFGFVISLSSTAVLLSLLQEKGLLNHQLGQDILGVLLVQDIAVIPMLIILGQLGGSEAHLDTIVKQVIGGAVLIGVFIWLVVAKKVHLPFGKRLRTDHELQVFLALGLCFGVALVTGLLELSAALGAFVAGMVIGVAKETAWVHHRLDALRVILVAMFFVSIGMLVDLDYLQQNYQRIFGIVLAVFVLNTVINALVLRVVGRDWRHSWYAGAMLAQIGEFAFVIAAVGWQSNIIAAGSYQLVVAVIALSLLFSPFWVKLLGMGINLNTPHVSRFFYRPSASKALLNNAENSALAATAEPMDRDGNSNDDPSTTIPK